MLFVAVTVCFFDYDYHYAHEHEHDSANPGAQEVRKNRKRHDLFPRISRVRRRTLHHDSIRGDSRGSHASHRLCDLVVLTVVILDISCILWLCLLKDVSVLTYEDS